MGVLSPLLFPAVWWGAAPRLLGVGGSGVVVWGHPPMLYYAKSCHGWVWRGPLLSPGSGSWEVVAVPTYVGVPVHVPVTRIQDSFDLLV